VHLSAPRLLLAALVAALPSSAAAAERLCDPAFEDCRAALIQLIRAEQTGIDVAFWFMEDARYSNELIAKARAGVPVRVLVDPRANATYPLNGSILSQLASAGIPMRRKNGGGILHWKMMLFAGQNTVEFSGANYSPWALSPVDPYRNYIDEAIFFSDDASVVRSFMRKFDDLWTNRTGYADYANVNSTPSRRYPQYPIAADINFAPQQSYRSRAVAAYASESQGIDAIMFRITDRAHTDALIAARQRGVRVRLLTEQEQYRDPMRLWHSWNVDRLYMAGIEIRHRAHLGLNHQKSVILHSRGLSIFGSSNWTSPSSDSQEEHNYFTTKGWILSWFWQQFERKWNNTGPAPESQPFQPLPPDAPEYRSPANGAVRVTGAALVFDAGPFAHLYDIYLGTTPAPQLIAAGVELGPTAPGAAPRRYQLPPLAPNTTYYWRIVARTMAHRTAGGATWSFSTGPVIEPKLDLNGDAKLDLLWHHQANGQIAGWLMNGLQVIGGTLLDPSHVPDTTWKLVGVGDVNGEGWIDLVWQNTADGRVAVWLMNGPTRRDATSFSIPRVADLQWKIRGVGDANRDGRADLYWQHEGTGQLAVWLLNGPQVIDARPLTPSSIADLQWKLVGTGDFDRDGSRDLVFHHQGDGRIGIWFMNGTSQRSGTLTNPSSVPDLTWQIRAVGDLNSDGNQDFVWQNIADGRISAWLMNGLNVIEGTLLSIPQMADTNWHVVGPR
jgi:hypothetical protein